MWARDDLVRDPSIAAEVLIKSSWRWSLLLSLQLTIGLLMQWQSSEKVSDSAGAAFLFTAIIVFIFIAMTLLVGYLIRHARLCLSLSRRQTGLSTAQLENAAMIYLFPTLIWLAGLWPLIYAVKNSITLYG